MVRIAKEIDLKKLERLKKQINDESYMKAAILAIAQELTKKMVEEK